MLYHERMAKLGLKALETRRLHSDLTAVFKIFKEYVTFDYLKFFVKYWFM